MSAIGGIVCWDGQEVNTEVLMSMSRAMLLRGKDQRGAYLHGGAGVFHNRAVLWESASARQPLSVTRNGSNYTVILDGDVWWTEIAEGLCEGMGMESAAELILECYLAFGAAFLEYLEGAFALAILDEARGELILARDADGRKPLFYAIDHGVLAFASEIKGLLRFLKGTAEVDGARLRAHLDAPCGAYTGESLYRELGALDAGHCGVYSRLGLTLFPYDRISEPLEREPQGAILHAEGIFCPEEAEMKRILTETLFAFDYPQFDHWMPTLFRQLESLTSVEKQRTVEIEDGTLYMDIGYARERADRLGQIKGALVYPVPPALGSVRMRELKKIDRLLRRMLGEVDSTPLARVFGADWQERVSAEKNLAKRIRMQGMLYQTLIWLEHYPISVVSEDDSSRLSTI